MSESDRTEELYAKARALPPGERELFLAENCQGDAELEAELGSLLEWADSGEAFFAELSQAVSSPAAGHQVGHYRLLGSIGSGGMGAVYRAHDTRLDRVVALKFLPSWLSAQPEARERFLVEARAAAALDHPNICSIHEIGETSDGRPFIAMACYEGETLKERLSRGPLPSSEAVAIAVQLALGLGAAHARGIVHRDVKPGNIMLTPNGTVKLLDFGLAKVADMSLTSPAATPGTVAYMSPEQARGDAVGPASDLWSLGVVLYEMLAGARPFRGGNDRVVIQEIRHQDPEPLQQRLREVPGSLTRVVERLLRKDPEGRYSSAEDLVADLAPDARGAGLRPARRAKSALRMRLAASAVAVLLAAAALIAFLAREDQAAGGAAPAIAVLPFSVYGAADSLWREGMVDLLSAGLDGAGGLRAISSRTVLGRWRQGLGEAGGADLPAALDAARRMGARYALVDGSMAAGAHLRLTASVYDLTDGRSLGRAQAEGSPDSVLALVDRFAMQALGAIFESGPAELPAIDLASITTSSLSALKSYLDGEARLRRWDVEGAIEAWESAIAADSMFALAFFRLAMAHGWDEAADDGGYREHLNRAYLLADRLPERERSVVAAAWDRNRSAKGASARALALIGRYPDDADAWYELGEAYFHNAAFERDWEKAERAFRHAAELQPGSAYYQSHLIDLAFGWRPDSGRTAREIEAYLLVAPESERARGAQFAFALAFGGAARQAEARDALDTLSSATGSYAYHFLRHPRLNAQREELFDAFEGRRPSGLDGRAGGWGNVFSPWYSRAMDLGRTEGRVREALASLDDPRTPENWRYCGAYYLFILGLGVPDTILDRFVGLAGADSAMLAHPGWVTCAAVSAAHRGRWNDYDMLMAQAGRMADLQLHGADTARSRRWRLAIEELQAHQLWARGDNQAALKAFEDVQERYGGPSWMVWFVGFLSYDLGRLEQAEEAFRSRYPEPLASLYLGRIYEQTGRPDLAREEYEFFASSWRHADAELQPRVEEARAAAARLAGAER